MGHHTVKLITKEKMASRLGYLPSLFPGPPNQKETPRSSDPGVFQSVYPTGTSSYRWTNRITQGGSGSEGPLPGLGIMIGGRMIEPGPGKMLNNTYRIGVPYFLHREMACSLNHEGRRTLTTT